MDWWVSTMKHLQLSLRALLPLLSLASLLATGCARTDTVAPTAVSGLAASPEAWAAAAQEPASSSQAEQAARFDVNEAHHRLSGVDLSKCREAGAPRGFGHAKVSFKPSGDIAKVIIDEPFALRPKAAKCVGDELATATIPVFSGDLVTVGTTWYVP